MNEGIESFDTLIVGAGVAGLTCALELERQGRSVAVLEASDDVGGRVRTDSLDGFLLDRGFQVLLTAYPECKRLLDYRALDLRPFYPGALVRFENKLQRVADPFRRPLDAFKSLLSPVGTLADKFRVLAARRRARRGSLEDVFRRPAVSTEVALLQAGFSSKMIDRFFRPFLGGIFFDLELETSSRMFEFVFRMFSSGDTALPAKGMGQIPKQLQSGLKSTTVRTQSRVRSVAAQEVILDSGERLVAKSVVVATDWPEAARLVPGLSVPDSRSTDTLYFATESAPVDEAIIVLDGEGTGPVTTLCVPSRVSSSYAPPGAHLVSANVIGTPDAHVEKLEARVRRQLLTWFGSRVESWRHLRTYRIAAALPCQLPDAAGPPEPLVRPGIFLCGDYRENASIQGAMVSGGRAAAAVLESDR